MKYARVKASGNVELFDTSEIDLPDGALYLDDAQYEELANGAKIIVNGAIVANPDYHV